MSNRLNMKIGLMSDTHGFLDARVLEYFKEVDEIWHAGDIGNYDRVAVQLEKFKPLRAVYGNIDDALMRRTYPENLHFESDCVKIFMTHIGGYPGKFPARIREAILLHKPDIFICGHSHILRVMFDKTLNVLCMNPGACGNQGIHKIKTLLRFETANGKLDNLEVIELA